MPPVRPDGPVVVMEPGAPPRYAGHPVRCDCKPCRVLPVLPQEVRCRLCGSRFPEHRCHGLGVRP